MRWLVEVKEVVGDHDLVAEVVERAGYKLAADEETGHRLLLTHPKYEECETASPVHADAKKLADTLSRFSELEGTLLGFALGAVQSKQPDGTINKHLFAELHEEINLFFSATVTLTRNPAISEAEHQRLIAEAEAKADEQKRLSIIRRASAALQRPRILEVMEIMNTAEPTTTQLGHIVDLVQDECGGDLGRYATRKQLKRFNHSINHPQVFGLEARHAVSAEDPPPKPMDFAKAIEFARSIGRSWLAEFERDE